ncbi:MAG: PKD repeat protein [Desulforhopalus sp.]|jgi:PKD repeat protein
MWKGDMKMCKTDRVLFTILFTVFFFCFGVDAVFAKDYSFSWSANTEPVEGYKLHYKKGGTAGPPFDGTDASEGVSAIDLGKVTNFTITGLEDNTTYHFALIAYIGSDESDYTDIITVFPDNDGSTTDPLSTLPVAAISASTLSGEAPLTLSFNGNSSTSDAPPIAAYNWGFGDNSTGSGSSVNHVYNAAGEYIATLTVEDSNGTSEEVSVVITVTEVTLPNSPVASISASVISGTAPLSVSFDGSASTGEIATYSWDFGDSSSAGSGMAVDHVYSSTGNYTAILTVTDTAGQTAQKIIGIAVSSDGPVVGDKSYSFSWSANAEPVEGYKLHYKKGGIAGPPFDGTDAAEGISAIDLGKVTSFTVSGLEDNITYHFALTAYNGSDESDYTDIITVFPESNGGTADPLLAVISVDRQTGEAPLTVGFNGGGSTGSITDYSWAYGDGGAGTGSISSHTYQNSGSYTATLTVKNGEGAMEQASVLITITEPVSTALPVAGISASTLSGEAPLTVSFNGNSSTSDAPPIAAYNWGFGDNSTGSGSSINHVYNAAGEYIATLTVEDSNGTSEEVSVVITVTEVTLPNPPVASISASVISGTAPLSVSFDGSASTGEIATYSWDFGDSSSAGSGPAVDHVYSSLGNYTAILTVTDTAGQTAKKIIGIAVSSDGPVVGDKSYSFSWSANAEPVEGYKLHYKKGGIAGPPFDGMDASEGISAIDLGKVTSFTVTGLEDNTTYHFALTAYNGSDESGYTDIITVFPESSGGTTAPLSAVLSVDMQTGEVPLTVSFNGGDSTGSVTTYSWNFGDGEVGEGATVIHRYDSAGIYIATLSVTDENGLSVQESIDINVSETTTAPTTPPTAVVEVDYDEGIVPFISVFNGGSSTCDPGVTIDSYEWDFGDGSEKQYGRSVEHFFSQTGTYMVALKVTDSGGYSGEGVTFVTARAPVAEENTEPIAVFTETSTVGAAPLTVEFNASGSSDPDGDSLSYSWAFGDGAVASGVLVEHVYTTTGVFSVLLLVEDGRGATTEANQTIAVLTDDEYKKFLRGKKVKSIINIINTLLLNDE